MINRVELTDEKIINYSGIKIANDLLNTTNLKSRLDEKHKCYATRKSEVIYTQIALLCLGKTDFDNINIFKGDESFNQIMDFQKSIPESTYRQNLDKMSKDEKIDKIILEDNVRMLKNNISKLTPCYKESIPLDIDVTPLDNSDSKKEGVSWTYKKFMGYAPIMAYLGEEGYLINTELREGSQHCQSGTLGFLKDTIKYAKNLTYKKILLRMDSGNDSIENIYTCHQEETKSDYIIKRNLRKESLDEWYETAVATKEKEVLHDKQDEYFGHKIVEKKVEKEDGTEETLTLKIAFHVKKIKEKKSQKLLIPVIEVDTYWTSLEEKVETIVKLYNNHGTSEQFHSEIKSDMDIERLPSSHFDTNYLFFQLGMVAYNILRLVGQKSLDTHDSPLKTNVERRRIRTIIQNVMYLASKVTKHARKIVMKISKHNAWANTFLRLEKAFVIST